MKKIVIIASILQLASCRGSKEPYNKQQMSKTLPSQEISGSYKSGFKKVEKLEKRRMKKEARDRYKRFRKFQKNEIR